MNYIANQYKMPELLCCPFCGQDAEMRYLEYDGFDPMYWVSCPNCFAAIKVSTTEKEAKDVWNRRHPDCEHAEWDGTGCLGYCGCTQDDEPIEACKRCRKYTGNIEGESTEAPTKERET
jgi:hypothetical protein